MAGPGLRQRDSVVTVSSQKSPLLSARDSCSGGSGVGGQARPGPARADRGLPQREPWAPWLCSRHTSWLQGLLTGGAS